MRVDAARSPMTMLALLCLMVVVGRVAFDIYIPALPIIQQQMQSPSGQIQLTISLFSLGFGVSQLFYGPFSDWIGRRIVLLVGFVIFVLGCAGCYFATTMPEFVAARLVTGVGVGSGVVIARAMARDRFVGKALAKVCGAQTLALTAALFIAPLLGSYLMHWFSWRADFMFLFFLGLLCLFIFFRYLPETREVSADVKQKFSFSSTMKDYLAFLRNRHFLVNAVAVSFSFAGLVIYFQLSPFIFQHQFHLTPVQYSWLSGAIAIAYIVGTFSLNQQLKKSSLQRIMRRGCYAMLLGAAILLLGFVLQRSSIASVMLATMVYVYGLRLIMPAATSECLSPFGEKAGSCAAALGAILMLICALVSYLCSLIAIDRVLLLGIVFALLGVGCILNPRPVIPAKAGI